MRIVFFGSSDFGIKCLQAMVAAGHDVVAVVTQPDRRQGRGMRYGSTAVKDAARQMGLRVEQPASVNSPEAIKKLQDLAADLFVIVAYGQKFSAECLAVPRIMPLNVHASLLPQYRGAAPIARAILEGQAQTGNTVMRVTPAMDAGPVILQSRISIAADETAVTLQEKLALDAPTLLLEALARIEKGSAVLTPQDDSRATVAPRLTKESVRIRWDETAVQIDRLVRASLGWSAAYTTRNGRTLKIYALSVLSASVKPDAAPGTVTETGGQGIVVACGQGIVCLSDVQLEGKKRLSACEFIKGAQLAAGERLGC